MLQHAPVAWEFARAMESAQTTAVGCEVTRTAKMATGMEMCLDASHVASQNAPDGHIRAIARDEWMSTHLSLLEFYILSVLVQKERYGLEIVQAVKSATEEKRLLSLGSLYTTLRRLEKKGLVTSRWGETIEPRRGARRRYYRLTALGAETFTETQRVLANLLGLPRPT
jgi:PadR family transcriptional regulator, regulatory protein PadR